MYKTVRHGENSLQYTILPQTEEVLNNSGLKGKGRDYSPSIHIRRSKRRSTVKYVLLIILGIVIALALASIPLYVMNGALYGRAVQQDHHETITVLPAPAGRELMKSRKKELKIFTEILSTLTVKTDLGSSDTPSVTTATTSTLVTKETITTLPWTVAAVKSRKSSAAPATTREIATEVSSGVPYTTATASKGLLPNDPSVKPWDKDIIIRPEVTTSPENSKLFIPSEKPSITNTKLFDDVLITTKLPTTSRPTTESVTTMGSNLKDAIFALDDEDDFKSFSLEVDDVFLLPSLKPDPSDPVNIADEVTIARWPFVDVSSYFPWAGYSVGDNLLLPLLMAALSTIALLLLLLLAVKRRKRSHEASAQIGKLTADLQADDNTKLLTTETVEEVEE